MATKKLKNVGLGGEVAAHGKIPTNQVTNNLTHLDIPSPTKWLGKELAPPDGARPTDGGGGGGYGGGGGGGGGGGSAAPKNSSKSEARAVLYAGLVSILGRKPTKAEVDAYHKALGIFETANADGGISTDMRAQFNSDWVDEDPDLKAERRGYETATKYFDAFTKAIQSPVSI